MTQYVITQLLWDTSEEEPRWHRDDALWWSDWRSLPDQAMSATPQGWVLAGFPRGVVPPNSVDLGDSLGALVLPGRRADISNTLSLGEALPGDTLDAVFQSLLIRMGDPTSQTRWRGIRASGRRLQLRIGSTVVLDEPFDETHPAWNHTRDIFRAAYRRNRAHVDGGLMPLDALRRWTGHEMRKYGVTHDALLPPEYVNDGWRPPETTIGDDMTETTDTLLSAHTATGPNGGFGWTNYEGSDVVTVRAASDKGGNNADTDGHYRADSDLSSDDHRCEFLYKFANDAADEVRSVIRKDSTGTFTQYHAEYKPSDNRQRIEQVVSGTKTTLATKTVTSIGTTAFTGKIDIDSGDILRQYIDGTEEQSVDDSASPVGAGNLRTGLRVNPRSGAANDDILIDLFEAADLAAGGGGSARRRVGIGAGHAIRR